jgi:hypothetical protein
LRRRRSFGLQDFPGVRNGGKTLITVNASTLTSNLSGAVSAVAGGAVETYGNNQLFGVAGTGFTGPIALQ